MAGMAAVLIFFVKKSASPSETWGFGISKLLDSDVLDGCHIGNLGILQTSLHQKCYNLHTNVIIAPTSSQCLGEPAQVPSQEYR